MGTSSEAIGQLAGALAKAQVGLVNPRKTLTATLEAGGDKQSYRYAPLGEGLTIARRTLGRHELAIVQTTEIDPAANAVMLTTTLVHASGEWIATRWPVCPAEACSDPKRMGAALTYARRYSLFALVGLAGEDDLDAPDLKRVPREPADRGERRPRPIRAVSAPPAARSARRVRLRVLSPQGPDDPLSGAAGGETPASRLTTDPLADLARTHSEDALMRWAIAVLPHRNTLDAEARAVLDQAFRVRAETLGAGPDLILAFADDRAGIVPAAPSKPGEPHDPQAAV
jgi:hypothetical protein